MNEPPSDLPARLARLGEERDRLLQRVAQLEAQLRSGRAAEEHLQQFQKLMAAGQIIGLDYPVRPRLRYGHGTPPHGPLAQALARHEDRYLKHIETFLTFAPELARVPREALSPAEPYWINDWIPAFDGAAIYCFVAARNPRIYLEIGSGMSTKFARRAIRDHNLRTKIVSIDPMPRSEINALCDEIVRQPLEDTDPTRLTALTPEDMVFFDGSHRSFQNSDVTVFFTEILPAMNKGVLTGVHDIFLPHDYPETWLARYYSEQYLLACWLLAGEALTIELPAYHCSMKPELHGILQPLWSSPALAGAHTNGGAFWFTTARETRS